MSDFPKKTLESIRKLLIRQQKDVEKSLKEIEEDDPVKGESLTESSEPGTDSYIADSHTRTVALEEQLKKTNTSIKAALSKIGKGIYGKCEKCSRRIEVARLLAMPTAQYCFSCSKKSVK